MVRFIGTATGLPPVGSYSAVIVNVTHRALRQRLADRVPLRPVTAHRVQLELRGGETVPNLVKIRVGADGKFKINNTGGNSSAGSVQIIADIVGYCQ